MYLFLEREREGEREGEKRHSVVASHSPPAGDLARTPVMCPDWGSNWRPLGLWAGTQSAEPHQPGLEGSLVPYAVVDLHVCLPSEVQFRTPRD